MTVSDTLNKLALPLVFISLPLTVMAVLLPMYTSALGLTPLQVTGLYSVFSLGLVIMRLIIGYLTDRAGRKPVFLLGLILYTSSYFIYSQADTLALIYLGRSIQAMAAAFISIATYSMISDLNMEHNAHNFGRLNSYSEKGGLLGVILCFSVLNIPSIVDGWVALFRICTIISVIAVVYSIFFIKETKPELRKALTKVSLDVQKKRIILFKLLVGICTSMVTAIFVLYLQSRFAADLLEIGIAFLLPTVIIAFSSPKLGRISDKFGSKKILVICLGTLIVTLILLPTMHTVYFFGVVWTVFYIGMTMMDLTINGVYVEGIQEEIRGVAAGKLTMGTNIGTIIGPIIGGLAFQELSIKTPFFISAVGFVVLLAIFLGYVKR